MKKGWINELKIIGYLLCIMLLLFGSLPLSGVFAETTESEVEEVAEQESGELEESTEQETGEPEESTEQETGEPEESTEQETGEPEESTEQETGESEESIEQEASESEESTEQENSETEESTEQEIGELEESTTSDELELVEESATEMDTNMEAYLFSGEEYVSIAKMDGSVIKQGTALQREYVATLEQYHECESNLRGNLFLQTTYTVYQNDIILQEGALELGKDIDSCFCVEYMQTGEYTIEIKASGYEEIDGEYIWCTDKILNTFTEKIERSQIQLQASIEKEGHFSYREDYGRSVFLSFFVDEFLGKKDEGLYYTISSTNEAVIKPLNEQQIYSIEDSVAFAITGVGQAELHMIPMEHSFYEIEQLTIPVTVQNSTIQDEDYYVHYTDEKETILFHDFQEWKQFIEERKGWINGSVCVRLSEKGEKNYTGLGMDVWEEDDQEPDEGIIEQEEIILEQETRIQQYTFWCSHAQNQASTQKIEGGTREFELGIDKTAPKNTEITCQTSAYELTSTNTLKYYGEDVVITGAFEDTLSGVESIEYTAQADLGENARWEKIQNTVQDGTNTTFELILEQGIYTGVAIRATDIAGNKSELVEIKSENGEYLKWIVDKTEPILDVVLKTTDEKTYNGEWTNQPLTILVKESQKQPVLAGIQAIQYQYVSIGAEYEENMWTELSPEETLSIGADEEQQINKNGTYYFRAISNTGVITEISTQKEQAIRICLQQSLLEKQEKIETAPLLQEGQKWYNKKTGVPSISFIYPQYEDGMESLEYGAPITVHTRLTRIREEEKEAEIVYRTATVGVQSDEEYVKLIEIKNDKTEQSTEEAVKECIEEKIEALNVDFSYDKQTGYAQDGIYELEYWISDAAGNESEHDIFSYQIDTHEPTELEILIDGTAMKADHSQTMQYDCFYQTSVSGSASAKFGISGKGNIRLMVAEKMGDWENNTNWLSSDSFVVQPCTSGCIYMIAEDLAGNRSVLRTQGIVVDNQPPIGQYGGKMMTLVTKANENHFYSDNVQMEFSVSDLPQGSGFSGIESFSYTIGTMGKENTQRKELFSFTKAFPSKEEITLAKSYTTTEVIDATIFEGNDTYVDIVVKDRCGNIAISREELKIDVTSPKVEISFDQKVALNSCYYNTARTATIHVHELNFDPKGIDLNITKDGIPYQLPVSEWQSEGNYHFAYLTFQEDGDYTMTLTCTDLADNVSEEISVEPFTIDLIKPVIEISYDNNAVQNQVYYQAARTAYVTVKEHNFRETDFVVEAEPLVTISNWSHNGDEHSVQISFTEDNHYRFSCSYMDLAGNIAEPMEDQEFYIDSIAPQIVIQGVEDNSANAGEIQPVITVYDSNRNVEGTEIIVTTGMGEEVPIAIQTKEVEQGYTYILTDMSEKEDNIYFLKVLSSDMAENKSELTYRFSLNRKGSVYDLSKIADMVERTYNRSDQLSDIIITEMNVDQIEEYSIYITRNGSMLPCVEISNPSETDFKEDEIYYSIEASGNEKTGYCNRYYFYQENFEKEGIYRIICYSKDRAGNEVNNTIEEKQAEISFIIDNTAPKVMMDGIETGGIYNEEAKTVHIMVQDNFMLKEARFTLYSQAGEELKSWNYMELVEEAGEVMTIEIPCREEIQFLYYQISDVAGNEIVLLPDSEEVAKGFLITTNQWLQFINSPIRIVVAIGVLVVICGVGIYYLFKRQSL